MWSIVYAKQAAKDSQRIAEAGLKQKTLQLIGILRSDPYQNPPPYEKLVGGLMGAYSRRIALQHRLVYQLFSEEQTVRILRMWTRYV